MRLHNIGLLLKVKRGENSLRKTAKEIGLSAATLSRIERGRKPDIDSYEKILLWLKMEEECTT